MDQHPGLFQGWIVSQVFLGQMNTTGGNSSYFLGLTRVNETDNSFVAVSIIFNQQQYVIRYAMGNL